MTFKELDLQPAIQKALVKLGYVTPTPIQAQSIPSLLEGKDLIGIAQTGTGKTASFTLPILNEMSEKYPRKVRTLVLAPTRELAAQIGESFSKYGEFLKFKHTVIFGGVRQGKQVQALRSGVDILVATPGRLLDLMNQGFIHLKSVEYFVLDEADRMLDMGFIHDIKKVIAKLPDKRQSLFFSATMSPEVNTLARKLLKNPVHVEITPAATTVERIQQQIFFVDQENKEKLLLKLLKQKHLTSILVFTRTKHRANKVAKFLNQNNIFADAIHGNKTQNARTKAIGDFKRGKTKVLVATDIAARGIDIDNISHVINFELPNESESYVHRIGRTARAGTDGTAYSFCAAQERNYLRNIERLIKQNIEVVRDHKFHSEAARTARGADAKPPPRGQRGQRGAPRVSKRRKPRDNSRKKQRGRGQEEVKVRTGTRVKSKDGYRGSGKSRGPRSGSSGSARSSDSGSTGANRSKKPFKKKKPFNRERNNSSRR
ncbi:DEAD/DEAH box helicase [archaeon]|nr:DEAD/DEAH box helicase [archaeon]MBT6761837.1 DEAD/DEAH box helicase [archaeon]